MANDANDLLFRQQVPAVGVVSHTAVCANAAGRVAYQVDSVGCPAVKAVEYDAALGAGVSNGYGEAELTELPTPYYQDDAVTLYCADCRDILPLLPKVDLVVTDPPYYRVKGEFDFVWDSFDKYLEFIEVIAASASFAMKQSGTLFIFGDHKNIAYVQVIFDKHFRLENHIVWRKPASLTDQYSDGMRSFPLHCFERVLMYSAKSETNYELTGLQSVHDNNNNFRSIKEYLDSELDRASIGAREVNELWGNGRFGHCFGFTKTIKVQFQFLSGSQYESLRDATGCFNKPYQELRQEYEAQRQEYEAQRRYFNNSLRLTDCWEFPQGNQSHIRHETVKPLSIIKAMITTCCRPSDTILDPFCGSGTTLVAAKQLGRKSIGVELEEKYCAIAAQRCRQEMLL